jgi:hypothetical protein
MLSDREVKPFAAVYHLRSAGEKAGNEKIAFRAEKTIGPARRPDFGGGPLVMRSTHSSHALDRGLAMCDGRIAEQAPANAASHNQGR